MENQSPFSVVPSNAAASSAGQNQNLGIAAELATPPVKLNAREKKLWAHITSALLEYGLIHRTDAMMLTVICRTFDNWVQIEEELAAYKKSNNGSYLVTTPNQYQQPHQLFYAARDLKRELLQWLPEAALTITSFHKIKSDDLRPPQGDLFSDPLEEFRKRGQSMRMRAVPSPGK